MNSLGKLAEIKACEYLKKKKYKLLDFNYVSAFGEIDLIMQKGKTICFIEVKMRNQNSIAAPAEFVDYRKQQKIISTAQIYISNNNIKLQPRFDIIEVIINPKTLRKISLTHIENAFTYGGGDYAPF